MLDGVDIKSVVKRNILSKSMPVMVDSLGYFKSFLQISIALLNGFDNI